MPLPTQQWAKKCKTVQEIMVYTIISKAKIDIFQKIFHFATGPFGVDDVLCIDFSAASQ